jgi:flagellar hook assembly protein FlgD
VPSRLFITKFALANAYPNPFRGHIRIFFDVPMINGKMLQDVGINVYNAKGNLVRQLAKGKYEAGHYTVTWDGAGDNDAALGSSMYIIQMKAFDFDKKLKLFRIR